MPRDLETVVLKCLGKDPAERYSTAEEMAEDLRRFLADRPIRARRASPAERLWRWCRRNRRAALMTAALAVLGLATAVGLPVGVLLNRQRQSISGSAVVTWTRRRTRKPAMNSAVP